MLEVEPTNIDDVMVFVPRRFGDDRGYFSEVFNKERFAKVSGLEVAFVQDNESLSTQPGTIRGLHFQKDPHAQGKLVRCVAGKLFDVAVDLRVSSETFGQHVSIVLDPKLGNQLWIPAGFGHGFCTLEPDTVVTYKTTGSYDSDSDRSMSWSDTDLKIAWPAAADAETLSAKDANAPTLAELKLAGDLFE